MVVHTTHRSSSPFCQRKSLRHDWGHSQANDNIPTVPSARPIEGCQWGKQNHKEKTFACADTMIDLRWFWRCCSINLIHCEEERSSTRACVDLCENTQSSFLCFSSTIDILFEISVNEAVLDRHRAIFWLFDRRREARESEGRRECLYLLAIRALLSVDHFQ